MRCSPFLLRASVCLLLALTLRAAEDVKIDFARQVEPVFRSRCYLCHGPQQQMNGLRLDERDMALRGSNSGPVIVPGKSAESKLIHRVTGLNKLPVMPPTGAPLTAEEIGILKRWIDQGANWPASASGQAHWSFQPIRRPAVPQDGAANPIDAFILARLQAEKINPSPEADRFTLIRRLSLDLIGLPPAPQELSDFLADKRPDAYGRLVDRLLASPHYGEKWARHWLDLARYADSDGYEKDLARPYAWRYRHWLIEALNQDLPFDRFTLEQIAGDLLPNATVDQKIATGFHRNTLTNREAGSSRAEIRFEQLVDRTNTVSTTWLGLTVGCAQCHNHKYDPIMQKDFYQMFAFFNSAEEENIDAPLPGELGPYLQALPAYLNKRAELLTKYNVPQLQAEWERNIRAALDDPGKRLDWDFACTSMRAMLDGAEKILRLDPARRTRRQAYLLTNYFVRSSGPDIAKDKPKLDQLKELRQKLDELDAAFPALSQAQTMIEEPNPPQNYLYLRGDYRNPGIEVQPCTPAFLPPMPGDPKPSRLTLARWIVSKDNPLTARVVVNRMWQEFFGQGLVKSSEDFGKQGDKPTHPELLDWLASEFMERGWSVKQMHRMIVTSATYRQSSQVRKELESRDPDNSLLARQARLRLPAELVRDSALAASGLLNRTIGGKSVRPPQPKGVAELAYANSVKWEESKGADRYRRGLYIHFQRTVPYPQLMNFDSPDSLVTCSRRRRSNTPLQALNLLNDPVFVEAAQALAVGQERSLPFADRLTSLFERCLARRPTARESEKMLSYYQRQQEIFRKDPAAAAALSPVDTAAAAWVGISSILLNLDEFVTRE